MPLRDVLAEEVRPFARPGGTRFELKGDAVLLRPRAALAFGMIIHELVTNAVKYGAFSVPDGKVALHWDVDRENGEDLLICRWTEQ